MMVRVGKPAPDFAAEAWVRGDASPVPVRLADLRGRWVVLFFYPRDFTFVCPTEIQAFARLHPAFAAEEAVVLGASTDSYFSHKAWYETDRRLAEVTFPVLADTAHTVSEAYGVLLENGAALRGTFVVDPDGVLRHAQINDLDVGRNVDETLRLLRALRTGELCPADWEPGRATLSDAVVPAAPVTAPPVAALAPIPAGMVEQTDESLSAFLAAERAALVLTRTGCEHCARYQTEIEELLAAGDLSGVAVGKLVLDRPGAIGYKRANPWLADVPGLPYTALYRDGRLVEHFSTSRGRILAQRLRWIGVEPAAVAA